MYDSGTDTTHLTSLTVPAGKLTVGNTYTWQVRYEDNYGGWSSYSSADVAYHDRRSLAITTITASSISRLLVVAD